MRHFIAHHIHIISHMPCLGSNSISRSANTTEYKSQKETRSKRSIEQETILKENDRDMMDIVCIVCLYACAPPEYRPNIFIGDGA